MIRITQLKLPIEQPVTDLEGQICQKLKIKNSDIISWEIIRRSLDARRGRAFVFSYTVDVQVAKEAVIWKKLQKQKDMERYQPAPQWLKKTTNLPENRPVVVGFGPAGMFCALTLAKAGLNPIVMERGRRVEERTKDVETFWTQRKLNPDSNVQFGEGGAGTFSDGKLNTLVKDKEGLGRWIMKEMVKAGAPEEILYDSKPHVGTDKLRDMVKNIREEILSLGGEIWFETKLEEIRPDLTLIYSQKGQTCTIKTDALFLGIGHSARDTFAMLKETGILMQPKPFAVGLRIEHPQRWIDQMQYREYAGHPALGPAPYKVTHNEPDGRGVYSFCMCPGGLVVAAASEEKGLVTNGMSNYARNEENANAAILVTISPEDYAAYGDNELAGVAFQRKLEQAAYKLGGEDWRAPAQYVGDYLKDCGMEATKSPFNVVTPSFTAGYKEAHLSDIFPADIAYALGKGLLGFDKSMNGFAGGNAVLTGVESRSSSPVRMVRDSETMQANIRGLYPMGEGAGYAGGIMSAAMDGLKAARAYLASLEDR